MLLALLHDIAIIFQALWLVCYLYTARIIFGAVP